MTPPFQYPLSLPIRKALCEYHRAHPDSSQKRLKEWLMDEHQVDVSIAAISDVLKHSSQYLLPAAETTVEDEAQQSGSRNSESKEGTDDEQDPGFHSDDEVIRRRYDSDEFDNEGMEDGSDTEVNEEMEDESDEEMEEDESDNQAEEREDMEEDGPLTISNLGVLDCPICTEPLSIPVYLCKNGHVACSSCCVKTVYKCPSCSSKIGHNRCFIVEKMLESVTAPCKNKKYGCEEKLKYSNKNEHEKMCLYTPCSCPVTGCKFEGTMAGLYSHCSCSHIFSTQILSFNEYIPVTLEKNQRYLIFCGEDNSIFVLNNFSEVNGNAINVVRIASLDSDRLSYDVKVRCKKTSVTMRSSLENVLKWEDCHPETDFLLVPEYCTTSEGKLHLELQIRGPEEFSDPAPYVRPARE